MAENVRTVYAQALFELCCEQGITAEACEELEGIGEVFEQNEELVKILRSPLVAFDEKKSLLEKAFGGRVGDTVFDFLCVATKRAGQTSSPISARSSGSSITSSRISSR